MAFLLLHNYTDFIKTRATSHTQQPAARVHPPQRERLKNSRGPSPSQ